MTIYAIDKFSGPQYLLVKFGGSQNLYTDFWLCMGLALLNPEYFKFNNTKSWFPDFEVHFTLCKYYFPFTLHFFNAAYSS